MFDFSKPAFPENPACKSCMTRPCRQLLSGSVYPGKLIFAHHRDFIFLPCYQPNFQKNQEKKTEEAALTDELVDTMTGEKKPVTVTNPRWEHSDEDKKSSTPDTASVGDEINLYVDVTGVPNGSRVTFDIFDFSSNPPMRIATASGTNEQGTACGKWTVEDPSEKGEKLKVEFEGIAKSKASERVPINCNWKEAIGSVALCIKENVSNLEIGNAECILKGEKNEYSGKTDENGLIAWNDIPLDQYVLKINIDSQEITKSVFWKKDSLKIQNIRIKQL